MNPEERKPVRKHDRVEEGRKLSRLGLCSYGIAMLVGIVLGPASLIDDLWGESLQVAEVFVPLFWLMGLGLNVVAIRRGATTMGVRGIIAGLLVPPALWVALFLVFNLSGG